MLGSELIYAGPGELMRPVRDTVWSGDVSVLLKTLTSHPERLHFPRALIVGKVISTIRIGVSGVGTFSLYGNLLSHLRRTYRENANLFPYPYDWRASNVNTAASLAAYIRACVPRAARIAYLAHSMGGIVARLMLTDPSNEDIAARTATFIQMGTPGLGSSKAYYTLKQEPSFSTVMQTILQTKWHLNPMGFHRLMEALSTFESLYELLPHESEHILVTRAGQHFSALEERLWPSDRSARISGVGVLHRLIRDFSLPTLLTIYSDDVSTDGYYEIDHNFKFQARYGEVQGDGTVSVASAVQGVNGDRRVRVSEHGTRHDEIQNSLSARTAIDIELARYGTPY
jgi:pimeloyl-ACP methyl ester carboxylesterase